MKPGNVRVYRNDSLIVDGWKRVILIRHIIRSIIPPGKHNFEHNTLVAKVTPKNVILDFTSIIRRTLNTRAHLSYLNLVL